jgi:UDP-2,3-diacylglucosamine hydrolase
LAVKFPALVCLNASWRSFVLDYFISDLHLSEDEPALTQLFFEFIAAHQDQMRALYVLGDFFDAWVGDDDDQPLTQEIAAQLAQLQARGAAIFLMHGNRDFLIGQGFAKRCGATLLPEVAAFSAAITLCHGDHLCTQDASYQTLRRQFRDSNWQQQFLAQPLSARRAFAAKARAQSKSYQQNLLPEISDVDAVAVQNLLAQNKARVLIHGHTHRPNVHALAANAQRIVLGDWRGGQPSWLALGAESGELVAHGQRWRAVIAAQ